MSDLSEFVTLNDTTLTTDSRRVAKHFRKRHDNVLRAFDNLGCSDEYRRLNFEETVEERPNPSGGDPITSRVVRMTKDGFVILAMSFTGAEAMRIKEAYIRAFNAMAEQLQRLTTHATLGLWEQRMALEKRDATSFMWASFGSRRMLDRRRELPAITEERARLDEAIQPELRLVHSDTAGTDLRDKPERTAAANETKRRSKRPAA